MKRLFDLTVSVAALVLLGPLLLLIALATAVTDGLPVLFTQQRVGRNFKPFTLLKFRTMHSNSTGPQITSTDDPRVTRVGQVLRTTKLDELPQLLNVIRGDMSLVGPRPEVPMYVEQFKDDFAIILTVRPGITGAGSVAFHNESDILAGAEDPQRFYVEDVLPRKIEIEKEYVATSSLGGDVKILAATVSAALHT